MPESVAQLLRALRPAGLWYGTLSAVVAISVWCLQDKASWSDWPPPIRCAMWSWLVATVLAVPYTHFVSAMTTRAERRSLDQLPVAPPPPQLGGGVGTSSGAPVAPVSGSPVAALPAQAKPQV